MPHTDTPTTVAVPPGREPAVRLLLDHTVLSHPDCPAPPAVRADDGTVLALPVWRDRPPVGHGLTLTLWEVLFELVGRPYTPGVTLADVLDLPADVSPIVAAAIVTAVQPDRDLGGF